MRHGDKVRAGWEAEWDLGSGMIGDGSHLLYMDLTTTLSLAGNVAASTEATEGTNDN